MFYIKKNKKIKNKKKRIEGNILSKKQQTKLGKIEKLKYKN